MGWKIYSLGVDHLTLGRGRNFGKKSLASIPVACIRMSGEIKCLMRDPPPPNPHPERPQKSNGPSVNLHDSDWLKLIV